MTTRSPAVDIRRQAGWLPHDQDGLGSWLAGHRDWVEASGEQVLLHPRAHGVPGVDRRRSGGAHVAKGEELGYFQFGGSTHCLVFGPGAIADFTLAAIPQPHDPNAPLVHVRSKLAIANPTV